MADLFGLLFLGLFCFAIWMWADALSVPGESWTVTTWTKKRWFLTWYAGGLVTMGIVPMGMAVYYYRTLRPVLRNRPGVTYVQVANPAKRQLEVDQAKQKLLPVGSQPSQPPSWQAPVQSQPPPGWYPSPSGGGSQWWDGNTWTPHRQPDNAVTVTPDAHSDGRS